MNGARPSGQQLGDERARNDHALVDVEAELAEPGFVRQIGGRHALVDAAREELRHLRALGLREPRVEERLEAVERQVQRVQQQVGGLVVGVASCRGRRRAAPRRSATRPSAASRAASRARWRIASSRRAVPRDYAPRSGEQREQEPLQHAAVDARRAARGRRPRRARSTLWIVALTGPSSTSSGQMSAMKRPSDVPPVRDSSGCDAGHGARSPRVTTSTSRPRPRQERLARRRSSASS